MRPVWTDKGSGADKDVMFLSAKSDKAGVMVPGTLIAQPGHKYNKEPVYGLLVSEFERATQPLPQYEFCAAEGEECKCRDGRVVFGWNGAGDLRDTSSFPTDGSPPSRDFVGPVAGNVMCSALPNGFAFDPKPGKPKACYCQAVEG